MTKGSEMTSFGNATTDAEALAAFVPLEETLSNDYVLLGTQESALAFLKDDGEKCGVFHAPWKGDEKLPTASRIAIFAGLQHAKDPTSVGYSDHGAEHVTYVETIDHLSRLVRAGNFTWWGQEFDKREYTVGLTRRVNIPIERICISGPQISVERVFPWPLFEAIEVLKKSDPRFGVESRHHGRGYRLGIVGNALRDQQISPAITFLTSMYLGVLPTELIGAKSYKQQEIGGLMKKEPGAVDNLRRHFGSLSQNRIAQIKDAFYEAFYTVCLGNGDVDFSRIWPNYIEAVNILHRAKLIRDEEKDTFLLQTKRPVPAKPIAVFPSLVERVLEGYSSYIASLNPRKLEDHLYARYGEKFVTNVLTAYMQMPSP